MLAIANHCPFGHLCHQDDTWVDGSTDGGCHVEPGNHACLLGDDVTDHRRLGRDDGGAGGITRPDVFGEGSADGALDVGMKFVQCRYFRVYINPYPEL